MATRQNPARRDFVTDVKIYAEAPHRSIPKRIEHGPRIGRIAEDNPDLTYRFIMETLFGQK